MTTAKIKYDEKSQNRPFEFRLEKNTPNPFDTETSIRFCIPRRCDVKLALTNNRDKVVCVLVNTPLAAGCYTINMGRYRSLWPAYRQRQLHIQTRGEWFYGHPQTGNNKFKKENFSHW
ncbi:hypothetical protein IIA29_10745 [candidate division KSB1 bacterium]|nr:hypothetical protein [candidate division KSB1 bacterium]